MNGRKGSMAVAAVALAAVLLTPLLGCHDHRRDSRYSRYQSRQHDDYQQQLAQRRRHDEEQRRLAEAQRRERERSDWRRNY